MELADSTLAALLGHAVQGVTGKHYIRRSDATLIAAADKIADAIDRANATQRRKGPNPSRCGKCVTMDATLEPLERETLHIWAPAMVSALVGDLTGALELMRKGPIPPAFVMQRLPNFSAAWKRRITSSAAMAAAATKRWRN
jgi:hypothetical protein